jgi:menaquinone-dependent protoporphyrinogen oxidase
MEVDMRRSELGRRRFIKTGGATAGALVVIGGGILAASGPDVDLPEPSYARTDGMGKKTLIVYASKAGSSAEVAVFIGKRLSERGLAVDVCRAKHVKSLDGYDAVVVGSAIRAGNWLPEATSFVHEHRAALAQAKTAFFTLCMTLRQDTPKNRETVTAYLKPVREILEPQRLEFFAGKMDYRKLALVPRLIVKAMKVPEGDFRNWSAISAWADALCAEVLVA